MMGKKISLILIGFCVLTSLILLYPQGASAKSFPIKYSYYPAKGKTIFERRPVITFQVSRENIFVSAKLLYIDGKPIYENDINLQSLAGGFAYTTVDDLSVGPHSYTVKLSGFIDEYILEDKKISIEFNVAKSDSPFPSLNTIPEPTKTTPAPLVSLTPVDQNTIKVYVNGKLLQFDVQPSIINGRTMVPMRSIAESLGLTVSFDSSTKTVTAQQGNNVVKLVVDGKAFKNGTEISLDIPAMINNERILVPARFLSEAFEASVCWDASSKTMIITKAAQAADNDFKVTTMCHDVNSNTSSPVNKSTDFNMGDSRAIAFIELEKPLAGYAVEAKWYFINSSGKELVFSDSNCKQNDQTFWFWLSNKDFRTGAWECEVKLGNKTKVLSFNVL